MLSYTGCQVRSVQVTHFFILKLCPHVSSHRSVFRNFWTSCCHVTVGAVCLFPYIHPFGSLSNSYTMGCPPVRGDNPRALASGLSYVQVDKHGLTILYHLHQCRPCTSSDISC